MARSIKGISFGTLVVKNLKTANISTCASQNTKTLKDTTRFYKLSSTTATFQAQRAFSDQSGNQELPPPPPPPSSPLDSNWKKWTAGIGVTTVITLLQFKEDVDFVMETAEEIVEVVEVVAEAVDMVAEKIADDLPDGSKLKTTVDLIEEAAETVTQKAQKAEGFIDQVQQVEQKLSPIIDPVKQVTN